MWNEKHSGVDIKYPFLMHFKTWLWLKLLFHDSHIPNRTKVTQLWQENGGRWGSSHSSNNKKSTDNTWKSTTASSTQHAKPSVTWLSDAGRKATVPPSPWGKKRESRHCPSRTRRWEHNKKRRRSSAGLPQRWAAATEPRPGPALRPAGSGPLPDGASAPGLDAALTLWRRLPPLSAASFAQPPTASPGPRRPRGAGEGARARPRPSGGCRVANESCRRGGVSPSALPPLGAPRFFLPTPASAGIYRGRRWREAATPPGTPRGGPRFGLRAPAPGPRGRPPLTAPPVLTWTAASSAARQKLAWLLPKLWPRKGRKWALLPCHLHPWAAERMLSSCLASSKPKSGVISFQKPRPCECSKRYQGRNFELWVQTSCMKLCFTK